MPGQGFSMGSISMSRFPFPIAAWLVRELTADLYDGTSLMKATPCCENFPGRNTNIYVYINYTHNILIYYKYNL